MSVEIRAALAKLDPKNEDHWTENGLPRLDALGLTPLPKRVEVTEAAPLYTRANPVVPVEAVKAEPVQEQPKAVAPNADQLAGLQGDLDAAEALVRDQQSALNEAQRAVVKAQAMRDEVITKIAKAGIRPDHENIHGIRAVLERSKIERAEKAAIASELKKHGITAKLLQGGSKLDQAMARKSGFGLQRPKMQQGQQG